MFLARRLVTCLHIGFFIDQGVLISTCESELQGATCCRVVHTVSFESVAHRPYKWKFLQTRSLRPVPSAFLSGGRDDWVDVIGSSTALEVRVGAWRLCIGGASLALRASFAVSFASDPSKRRLSHRGRAAAKADWSNDRSLDSRAPDGHVGHLFVPSRCAAPTLPACRHEQVVSYDPF